MFFTSKYSPVVSDCALGFDMNSVITNVVAVGKGRVVVVVVVVVVPGSTGMVVVVVGGESTIVVLVVLVVVVLERDHGR